MDMRTIDYTNTKRLSTIRKPNAADIATTKDLLNDIYANIDIPYFETIGELIIWRNRIIDEALFNRTDFYLIV